jgi:hypothetical protein
VSGRAQAYANLAYKLGVAERYEEALVWCDRALELARAIGNELAVAHVIDTRASIRLARGDTAAAAEEAAEAAARFTDLGANEQAATALQTEAKAWEAQGEDERARATRARAQELLASLVG